MSNLSQNQQLDSVLNYLKGNQKEIRSNNLFPEIKKMGVVKTQAELDGLLNKLIRDKYVDKRGDLISPYLSWYHIAPDGITFDGYVKEEINSRQEKLEVDEIKNEQREQARRLVELNQRLTKLTFWIAAGTIAAAAVALFVLAFQIYVYFHPQATEVRILKY